MEPTRSYAGSYRPNLYHYERLHHQQTTPAYCYAPQNDEYLPSKSPYQYHRLLCAMRYLRYVQTTDLARLRDFDDYSFATHWPLPTVCRASHATSRQTSHRHLLYYPLLHHLLLHRRSGTFRHISLWQPTIAPTNRSYFPPSHLYP